MLNSKMHIEHENPGKKSAKEAKACKLASFVNPPHKQMRPNRTTLPITLIVHLIDG